MTTSRFARLPLVACLVFGLSATAALAQGATPAASPPAAATPAAPATPAQASPATPAAPPAAAPVQAPPQVQAPAPVQATPSAEASSGQAVDIPGKPAAIFAARAGWDEGFSAITNAFSRINGEIAKAGLKAAGRPLAVFLETDDNGFRFEAMVLLADKPADKTALGGDVKLGLSPAGKAIKFQHRGAYDDIDSTYEAITAYLDEKNLESTNIFIEEYLTQPKTPDDMGLELDIYVFVK